MNNLLKLAEGFMDRLKGSAHLFYHIVIIALSAGIVLSLHHGVILIAQFFLTVWSFIADEKIFLISIEIALAVLLILFFNYLGRMRTDRRLARIARNAGMVYMFPARGFLAQRRIRKYKEKAGFACEVRGIFSTGYQTLVEPNGDLHGVIQSCREAKIMLLNQECGGATARSGILLDPEITPERTREHLIKTIDFLRGLKALQKSVRLKLYSDAPFFKLAVLGDTLWLRHYHPRFDLRKMPEYVFHHNQKNGSLFMTFYQYFLLRWNDPAIPEFDFETGELVYRDGSGNTTRKETFG
jgi:hypothetical protein